MMAESPPLPRVARECEHGAKNGQKNLIVYVYGVSPIVSKSVTAHEFDALPECPSGVSG